METKIAVKTDFTQVNDALSRMSDALIEVSVLTNKEVYILRKFKRAIHTFEVWKRKLRRKHK
jgi:hypothetical protein